MSRRPLRPNVCTPDSIKSDGFYVSQMVGGFYHGFVQGAAFPECPAVGAGYADDLGDGGKTFDDGGANGGGVVFSRFGDGLIVGVFQKKGLVVPDVPVGPEQYFLEKGPGGVVYP